MGAAAKEEGRRKVGPADPATRRRLMNEAMGIKGPDTAENTKPRVAAPPEKPAKPAPARNTDIASGITKLTKPRANIEKALEEMGE